MTVSIIGLGYQAYADGASGAPSGTPQMPTLFSGYVARPPWSVAGVDYPVGINSSYVTFKVPGTDALPTGASVTNVATGIATGLITLAAGSNTVFDGWNLSGYAFYSPGGPTPTAEFTNCTFGSLPSAPPAPLTTSGVLIGGPINLTVKYCNWTGGGLNFYNNWSPYQQQGTTHSEVWQYNYFYLMPGDIIGNVGGGSVDFRFNAINQLCCNGPKSAGVQGNHMNAFGFNGSGAYTSVVCNFNTFFQEQQCQGGEIIQLYSNNSGTSCTSLDCSYNSIVVPQAYYQWTMASPAARQNNFAYSAGDMVTVADASGYVFFCTVGGTSASSEPAAYASGTNNFALADGTCVFNKLQFGDYPRVLPASYIVDSEGGFALSVGGGAFSNNYIDCYGTFGGVQTTPYPYYNNQMRSAIPSSNNINLNTGTAYAAPIYN